MKSGGRLASIVTVVADVVLVVLQIGVRLTQTCQVLVGVCEQWVVRRQGGQRRGVALHRPVLGVAQRRQHRLVELQQVVA